MAAGWQGLVQHDGYAVFACPEQNCYYRVRLDGNSGADHRCPFIGPTREGWSMAKVKVAAMWDWLDQSIDVIKSDNMHEHEYHKARARALCDTIQLFMGEQWFANSDAVAKEAMQRWKARQAGETRDTPGITHLVYAEPEWFPVADGKGFTSDIRQSKEFAQAKRVGIKHNLSSADVASIKHGAASGMFTEQDLASMYKISTELVAEIVSG